MEKKDITLFRNKFHVGDTLTVPKGFETGKELVAVKIWDIYPDYAIVSNGNYRWCIPWTDLMAQK